MVNPYDETQIHILQYPLSSIVGTEAGISPFQPRLGYVITRPAGVIDPNLLGPNGIPVRIEASTPIRSSVFSPGTSYYRNTIPGSILDNMDVSQADRVYKYYYDIYANDPLGRPILPLTEEFATPLNKPVLGEARPIPYVTIFIVIAALVLASIGVFKIIRRRRH